MRSIVDGFLTVVVLLLLVGAVIALPFIVILIVICIVGFLVYASIHDNRVAKEEEQPTDVEE
jgi:uncharacterized integral membrane protein